MKKIVYIQRWGNDYTLAIYLYKIASYILTVLYFLFCGFNKAKAKKFNQQKNFFSRHRIKLIEEYNRPNEHYNFNGILFPKIQNTTLMRNVYEDSLKVYTEYNDNYSYTIVDDLEKTLPEGTYCYLGKNNEDITIKLDYTVIDAGAWIGDFSAYAAKKGANVFAFEPSPSNQKLLRKTIDLNPDLKERINIIPFGLGEKEEVLEFFENEEDTNTGGNSFNISHGSGNIKLQITTLDSWFKKSGLQKIDFIKSDIEGYERHLLSGAREILKKQAPVLSICTYHLPDDKEVLSKIILEANPDYKIIQRKMKLFAYIKK